MWGAGDVLLVPRSPRCRCGSEALAPLGPPAFPRFSVVASVRHAGPCHPGGPGPSLLLTARSALHLRPRASLLADSRFRPSRRRLHCRGSLHLCTPVPSPGRPEWSQISQGRGRSAEIAALEAESGGPLGGRGPWARPTPLVFKTCRGDKKGRGPFKKRAAPSPSWEPRWRTMGCRWGGGRGVRGSTPCGPWGAWRRAGTVP